MAQEIRNPLVRCDNCGKCEEQEYDILRKGQFYSPKEWGELRVGATVFGNYPNHIMMADLCPNCLKIVHPKVVEALKKARG